MVHTPLDASLLTVKAQTRAERKRAAREAEKNKAKLVMTREELDKYVANAAKEISEEANKQVQEIKTTMLKTAISCMESALCIVLSDELGFGKVRIQRIIDKMENQLDCIISGNVSLEEMEKEKERLLKENKHQVLHITDEAKEKLKSK